MFNQDKLRIGNGVDVHPLVKGRKLILGGMHIQHDYGCDGHSDGDVLVHSIMDALLGALDKGDIGDHFPSSDDEYKHANSMLLLSDIYRNQIIPESWTIANIDSTIILQAPIVKPYIEQMKHNLYNAFKSDMTDAFDSGGNISVKATTTDHLGFIGEKKGIAVISTCLLIRDND